MHNNKKKTNKFTNFYQQKLLLKFLKDKLQTEKVSATQQGLQSGRVWGGKQKNGYKSRRKRCATQ